MRINRFFNQGDSGGAPAPAASPVPPAPAAAMSADAGAQPAPSSESSATLEKIRETMKAGFQSLANRGKFIPQAAPSSGTPLPTNLTMVSQPQAATTPVVAPAVPGAAAPAPVATPAPTVPASPPTSAPVVPADVQAQTPASIQIEKFGRSFSMPEIESAIEMANYYHPKVMQLQQDFQALAEHKQAIAEHESALRSAPENILISAIQGNEQVRDQVMAILAGVDPQSIADYKAKVASTQTNEQVLGLQKQIETLNGTVKQWETAAQNARVQNHIQTVLQSVDRAVTDKRQALSADKVNITDQDLSDITDQVSAMIKTQKLQYDPQSVTTEYIRRLDALANRLKGERQQVLETHANTKPIFPPPPTGGGAPAMLPKAPTNFKEASNIMAKRLQTMQVG